MDDSSLERWRGVAAEVFSAGPVLVAYAYGSRVGGQPRPDSDLDVAILARYHDDKAIFRQMHAERLRSR